MSLFFIALALTNLVVLFLLVRLPVRTHWAVKVALIVAVSALTFLAWGSRNSGRGWPVEQPFPADAEYVSCVVIEPRESEHIEGAIYLWMIPLDNDGGVLSYRSEIGEPRAYQEPYSRDLHLACEASKKAASQGVRSGIKHAAYGRNGHGRYVPYVLPSVNLPRKDGS